MHIKEKLIIALDVKTPAEAREISELTDEIGAFKIGLQLFTTAGPGFVREISGSGVKIFLDLKFHDIPNTVAKAAVEAARLGVWMFNVHALGGSEMMKRTVEEVDEVCARDGLQRPKIIAVTVLTSSNKATLDEIGIGREVEDEVVNLAGLAAQCGLDGVVASPMEAAAIRRSIDKPDFLIVTPGVRPAFATNDDQKRVMTPSDALANGADYLVIGRPVIEAKDRLTAVKEILGEIETACR